MKWQTFTLPRSGKTSSLFLYFLIADIDVGLAVAEVHTLDNDGLFAWIAVEDHAECGIRDGGIDGAFGETFLC